MTTSDINFASLLASRLCHDVVGPVGAIQNGLELMAEDEAMTEMALDLVRKSARQASAKLQFARMAYGAAGGAEVLDPAEAGRLTADMFAGERASLDWQWTGDAAPRAVVKIAMLLATFALTGVPRGGTVTVTREGGGVCVDAASDTVRTPPFSELLDGGTVDDPRAVQPFMIAQLAEANGMRIEVAGRDGGIAFRTVAA